MSAPQEVIDLVNRFEMYYSQYLSPSFNETEVRREFIDPFFKALGWDVDNTLGYDERYKEVVHEDAVKVGDSTKAPDYSFRIGGVRKFFVEAKKPAVNLKENPEPAYQVRRYAWSAQLPVSILTDFEEFIIYDCTARPSEKDKASVRRVGYYTFREYVEKWDEIAGIFSKQAILQGKFDDFASSLKAKKGGKGTAGIDDAFLAEIEGWRELLARNLALRNTSLTVRELNLAVQKTIDRIVFLRICEDRGVEEYGQLQRLAEAKDVYERLKALFVHADEKYNSGLFHFGAEPGREEPDTLTPGLLIDDRVLKEIIGGLYYPASPYEFSVFPADILGHVYEQFLGKVIRLTPSHQAKVEEKPEVKKAGGVFYTPTYIVDYIVRQTVGELTEGKTPKEVSDLRILDPACGSGSFLIGAYQYLLDWHVDWYIEHLVPLLAEGKTAADPEVRALLPVRPEPKTKGRGKKRRGIGEEYALPIYQMREKDWRLTTEEKKRILLNNIYGVDIDQQAVEVTKLSLLLKVLEGEKSENISKQLKITQERVLPSLHENIKCGNSLIGYDIYADVAMDEETCYRINAFDWNREFAEVMGRGGFDAVIGNPPYVRIQAMKQWAPVEVELYKKSYFSAQNGNYDIYVVFVEKGIQLLKESGHLGYILPHKFFTASYGKNLRKLIADGHYLHEIVHFGDNQIFRSATTYTCLLFLSKKRNESFHLKNVENIDLWVRGNASSQGEISSNKVSDEEWHFSVGPESKIIEKIDQCPVKMKEICKIFVGTQTSADDVYVLENCTKKNGYISGYSKSLDQEVTVEGGITKPFLRGKQIRRYNYLNSDNQLICPYDISDTEFRLYSENEMRTKFPMALEYLKKNKFKLSEREKGKLKGDKWFAYGYPKSMTYFDKIKLVVPDYNNEGSFTLDESGHFFKTGYGLLITNPLISQYYLLGVINSKLLFLYLKSIGTSLRGGYVRFWTQYVEKLPIRTIDPADPEDVARHDQMVSLVEQMLDLNKKLAAAHLSTEKEMLKRRIDATDAEIDKLVYKLYGLTAEEVAIVEGQA